ncbi:hypothetical protein FACS1894154_05680 [Betaproteobacteria bacterium]|nr:hypothetical protein FACS1894154_05680 [Betaproteobacteria bacterium]GHU22989.1 hypothetical protein FACS189488_04650 [Betaproteobacteria bacterium]
MSTSLHLGIDVAKARLDCALRLSNGKCHNKIVNNTPQGFADLRVWLDKQGGSDAHPDLKDRQTLLDSIPGVGERTIAMLIAFSVSPQRFDNARQATAFAGLDPRQHESGSSACGKPRLSKIGHAVLHKSLYMPAMVTLYRTDWRKHFFNRLSASGKAPKLIIAAMMRKLIHVTFGVLKSGKPFDPALHGA